MFLAEGNIEGRGEIKLTDPVGPVIKCFVIPSNSKIEQTSCHDCKKIFS